MASQRPSIRSYPTFTANVIAIAIFTDAVSRMIFVSILPTMLRDQASLHGAEVQKWTGTLVSVYGVAKLFASPLCGHFTDRVSSRHGLLMLGLIPLAFGNLLFGFGRTPQVLVLGKILQGISAALIWTAGVAVLVDVFPEDEREQVSRYTSLATNVGCMAGPVVGGLVANAGGYEAVIGLSFAIIAVDVFLRAFLIDPEARRSHDQQQASIDGHAKSFSRFVTGHEDREARPRSLVAVLSSSPRLMVALVSVFAVSSATESFTGTLSIFVRNLFGWEAVGAGLIFLPLYISSALSPVVEARINAVPNRARWFVAAGWSIMVSACISLRFVGENNVRCKLLLCILLFAIGLSGPLIITPSTIEISKSLSGIMNNHPGIFGRKGVLEMSYSLFQYASGAGTALGPVSISFIKNRHGWAVAGLALAVLPAMMALPSLLFTGGCIGDAGSVDCADGIEGERESLLDGCICETRNLGEYA